MTEGPRPALRDRSRPLRSSAIALAFTALLLLFVPRPAETELRPLVRDMLENLGAVELISEGVAFADFDTVARGARDLRERAVRLKGLDISTIGLDPARDEAFDAYLAAQERAAESILGAAGEEDGERVISGVQDLFRTACLPCHHDFRERAALLRPAVLFMTTFLTAWREINRGLAMNDYNLVSRRAREISAMSRVLTWDQVVRNSFDLERPEDRQEFRRFVARLTANAERVERAASGEDPSRVLDAAEAMWAEGCLACHSRFRD